MLLTFHHKKEQDCCRIWNESKYPYRCYGYRNNCSNLPSWTRLRELSYNTDCHIFLTSWKSQDTNWGWNVVSDTILYQFWILVICPLDLIGIKCHALSHLIILMLNGPATTRRSRTGTGSGTSPSARTSVMVTGTTAPTSPAGPSSVSSSTTLTVAAPCHNS